MEDKQYIDFNDIKEYVNIKEEKLFLLYLREIYRDLADRDESNKKKGIIKMIFFDYIKLPIFIAEKVFNVFDKDKDNFLNQKEFIYGMNRLYNGNFDETLKLIFEILDFNHDDYIEKDDVKMILGLLPLKTDKTKDKIKYKYQMESLEEIQQIINLTFDNKKRLNLEEFKDIVTKRKSDVFLQIICFLYQKKPFTDSNISILSTSKKATDIENTPQINKKIKCDNVLMPSPLQSSTLSPFQQLQSGTIKTTFSLSSSLNAQDEFKPEISGFKGMIRYHNRNIPKAEDTKNGEMEENGGEKDVVVNKILKNVENVFNSPSTFLKESNEKAKNITPFSLFSPENKPKEKSETAIPEINLNNDANEEDKAKYENYIYKKSEGNKLKKYYLVLIDKDIYYYKSDQKKEVLGMHNLSGCFFKENSTEKINEKIYYCFSIVFPKKERKYYVNSSEVYDNFIKALKKSFGYLNFFDYYEMLDNLGEGIFGSVKLGVEKKTNQRVAIKIIKKNKTKESDIELVRNEIDIMKLCYHPYVVHLLDHFENGEYIFIVMEYIKGGSLTDYMKSKKFNFTERRAAELIYQLAKGLKYLHKYGIIHRDLKTDNIMLTEASDKGNIKIMDFGLSKILGKKEKSTDGFGTLTFVSPEVLIRKPYNKEVDIWSLGVILYLMLSGELPFDDPDDNEQNIAKSIVYQDVKFPPEKFSKRSKAVIDLIKGCLTKDPKNRIKIDEILKGEWIKQQLYSDKA
jgi:Ca2+-binding EF-hand superfamily protein